MPDKNNTPPTDKDALVKPEYRRYQRKQIAEMADWKEGMDMNGVSISNADALDGSPKLGDKIARNPKNHADKWLVAAQYFADNFALLTAPAEAPVAVGKWRASAHVDENESKIFTAGIDCKNWHHKIQCHADTKDEAVRLRDTILAALEPLPQSAPVSREAADCAVRLVLAIFDEDRGDIDGGWLQDKAVECGVLIEVQATERCIGPDEGNCACAEYGDFPMTCYRLNDALAAHPAEPAGKGE